MTYKKIFFLFFRVKQVLTFHVNRLQADDSHEISRLFFFEKKLSSAAVVIGTLMVKKEKNFQQHLNKYQL